MEILGWFFPVGATPWVALGAGRHGGLPLRNITKPGDSLHRAVLATYVVGCFTLASFWMFRTCLGGFSRLPIIIQETSPT